MSFVNTFIIANCYKTRWYNIEAPRKGRLFYQKLSLDIIVLSGITPKILPTKKNAPSVIRKNK